MAPKADLVKIGKEGFDIIDRFFGKSSNNHHVPPKEPKWLLERQVSHQRYQPRDSRTYYYHPQPQEEAAPESARVTEVAYYQPQPTLPQEKESYAHYYQQQEAPTTAVVTKMYYPPVPEAPSGRANKTYEMSSYHYSETASQVHFREYQRATMRMPYN